MRDRRAGFTIPELLIVVILMGILTSLALPSIRHTTGRMKVRAARQQATSLLVLARAASVQRSAESRFVRTANSMKVLVDSNGTFVVFAGTRDMGRTLNVAVQGFGSLAGDTLRFDPRGAAIAQSSSGKLRFTLDGWTDSVCVSRLGKVGVRGGCT